MKYTVWISTPAQKDVEKIYHYIAEDCLAPNAAYNLRVRIRDAMLGLDMFPERTPIVRFETGKKYGLRQLIVGNYVVLYVILDSYVWIMRVLHSASDIRRIMDEELDKK